MTARWEKMAPRERALFCLTAAVVLGALVWQLAIGPYRFRVEMLSAEIEAKQIRLARLERDAVSTDNVSSARRERPARAASKSAGTSEQEMSRLLKAIEVMARSSSIRITDLKPLPAETKNGRQEYRVDLETQASIEQLTRFLYQLQSSPLALSAPRFSLSASDAPGDTRLRLSVSVLRTLVAPGRSG